MTQDLSLIVSTIGRINMNSAERVLLGKDYYFMPKNERTLRLETIMSRDEQQSIVYGKSLLEMQREVPKGPIIASLPVLVLAIYSALESRRMGEMKIVDSLDSMSVPRIITNSVIVYPLQKSMDYLDGRMNALLEKRIRKMTKFNIDVPDRKAWLIQYPVFNGSGQVVDGITTRINLPAAIKQEEFQFHTKIKDLLNADPDSISFLSRLYGQPGSEIKGKLGYKWLGSEITFNDQCPIYQVVLTPSLSDPYSVRIESMSQNTYNSIALVQDIEFVRKPLSPSRQTGKFASS